MPELQKLVDAVGADKKIVILDAGSDGVLQLANALAGESNLDAIHVFSHGSVGSLSLGSAVLDQASLPGYSEALAQIGSALSESGDLLLYGCNVAQGEVGQAFVEQLAAATAADVAASVDATGAAKLRGDWALEASVGTIQAAALCACDPGLTGLLADWPDANGIHWNELRPADKEDPILSNILIPTFGYYGGPEWGKGDTGKISDENDGKDDLDKIFWAHDKSYEAADKGPAERVAPLKAFADTNAITAMLGLSAEQLPPGSDAQAYAGATILTFLGRIEFTYSSTYPGDSSQAVETGIRWLNEGLAK